MKNQLKFQIVSSQIVLIATIFLFSLFNTSCNDEEKTEKPVINILEIGLSDSHVAYIGSDLHIEAEIVAEGKIDVVNVEIHLEEGSSDEIEASFDEFSGLKNTTFHKHIEIPTGTKAGTYHLHFSVTDLEGNQTTIEDEISIEELVDEQAPVLNITSAPESNQSFKNGETISISGKVTDDNSLAGMLVALVKKEDNLHDSLVTGNNTSVIVMLHTHSFDSESSHTFTASIAVGAGNDNNMTPAPITGDNAWESTDYYILIRCKDAKGNWVFSSHYPVTVQL
jgi:hypothetical protein